MSNLVVNEQLKSDTESVFYILRTADGFPVELSEIENEFSGRIAEDTLYHEPTAPKIPTSRVGKALQYLKSSRLVTETKKGYLVNYGKVFELLNKELK